MSNYEVKKHKTRQKRRSVARVTGYGARATRNKRRLTETLPLTIYDLLLTILSA